MLMLSSPGKGQTLELQWNGAHGVSVAVKKRDQDIGAAGVVCFAQILKLPR